MRGRFLSMLVLGVVLAATGPGSVAASNLAEAETDGQNGSRLQLYLSPHGDDTRSGSSLGEAILTLERAEALVFADGLRRDAVVYVAPGRYFGQQVEWAATMPDHSITFRRLDDAGALPVFDGCVAEFPSSPADCPGGTWFRLLHARGEATNLRFEHLRVERYQTAISFDGGRDREADSNGENWIVGCHFYDIGNSFNPALAPSTAAIRLVNSDDNRITHSHFERIVNTRREGLPHALYLAHRSDRNVVLRNSFALGTGDAVRVRDYSNHNEILGNRFLRIGLVAGYTDRYCDRGTGRDCADTGEECPSWGNAFHGNFLDGTALCETLRRYHLQEGDVSGRCAAPAGVERLRAGDNTKPTETCSTR